MGYLLVTYMKIENMWAISMVFYVNKVSFSIQWTTDEAYIARYIKRKHKKTKINESNYHGFRFLNIIFFF